MGILRDRYNEKKKKQGENPVSSGSIRERYELNKKYSNVQTDNVNGDFINSFFTDAGNFLGNTKAEANSFDTWKDLSSRANTLKAWTWQNRNALDTETYRSLNDNISTFESAGEFWNQFETPDDYSYYLENGSLPLRDATWKDIFANSFSRGYQNSVYGAETYKGMLGEANSADAAKDVLAQDKYQFETDKWYEKAISGAMEQLGQQWYTLADPQTIPTMLAGAGTSVGTVALAGQAGPQVALPEEVVTLPTAALVGLGAGYTASATSNALEIEAGNAYNEMRELGISEPTAKAVALGVGGVNAALEMVQVDELVDAFKIFNKSGASDTLLKTVLKELADRGIDVAKETGQEIMQEGVTLLGTQAASKYDKGEWAYNAGEVASRLGDTAMSSMLSFGAMNVPSATLNITSSTMQTAINNKIYKEVGTAFSANVDKVIEAGLESAPESESHKLAVQLQEKKIAGKEITNEEIGKAVVATVVESQKNQQTPEKQPSANVPNVTEQTPTREETTPTVEKKPVSITEAKKATGWGNHGAELVTSIANAEGYSLDQTKRIVETAYLAGFTGVDKAQASFVTDVQEQAFDAGKRDRIMQNTSAKEKAQTATVYGKDSGVIKNEYFEKLSPAEQEMFSVFAEDFGESAEVVNEIVAAVIKGKKYMASAEHSDGRVRGSASTEKPVHKWILHENGHRMEQFATDEWETLSNALYARAEQLGRRIETGVSEGMAFDRIKATHNAAGQELSTRGYVGEVVMRELETIFSSAEEFNAWRAELDANPQVKTAWARFMEWLTEILEQIKWAINNRKLSPEARAAARAEIAEIEHIKELYASAYKATRTAVAERTAAMESTKTEQTETKSEPDTLEKAAKDVVAKRNATDTAEKSSTANEIAKGEQAPAKKETAAKTENKPVPEVPSKQFSLELAEDGKHKELIEKAYSQVVDDNGNIITDKNGNPVVAVDLDTLIKRYDKILDIWKRVSNNLDSAFLNKWNKTVGKDRAFTVFKAQAGYKYNIELSSKCKKGIPLFEAIDELVRTEATKELESGKIGKEEKEILYEILKHRGFEIPCAICYVEQARQREGDIINGFLDGNKVQKSNGTYETYKIGWNEALRDIESKMKAKGIDYKFPPLSRDAATDAYTPAVNAMDRATQTAFYEALKEVTNAEIERYNNTPQRKGKKRISLIKNATPEGVNAALKGSLPLNLRMFKTMFNEPASRLSIDNDLLYSSMTTKNLASFHNGLYSIFNSQGGSGGYKTKQGTVVYWGDILGKKWKPEDVRKAGAIRNQSNSDLMMHTLLDQAQMYIDFTAKGYYLHAYTKVLAELKLFGKSDAKINASAIPRVVIYRDSNKQIDVAKTQENAGLDKNGNLIFDNIEGINIEESLMLASDKEYSKSICICCIGYSDKHILKMLDDDRIGMIIGFHDKTDNPDKRYYGARYAHNYNGVNEAAKQKADGTWETKHITFNRFIDQAEKKLGDKTSAEFNGKTYKYNDIPRLAADLYLDHCERNGLAPAYSRGGYDFSAHRNYYKLLADFGLYDSEGNYAPMKKVNYNMPDSVPYLDKDGNVAYESTEAYITKELESELRVMDSISSALSDKSEGGLIPEFVKKANERYAERKNNQTKQFSLEDTDGNELTKEQSEYFKDSKIRDIKGNLLKVYHSTDARFTVFDKAKIGSGNGGANFGKGFYFTPKLNLSSHYGDNAGEYYLNIKNPFEYYSVDKEYILNMLENSGYDYDKTFAESYDYDTLWDGDLMDDFLYEVLKGKNPYNELSEMVQNAGFDGIWAESEIVAFEPNQIKRTDNLKPTADADIRYSLEETDSEGNALTNEQVEYFEDSEARSKDGKLLLLYHGSQNDPFYEFAPSSAESSFGRYKFGKYDVNYFTTDKESAKSYSERPYGGRGVLHSGYANVKNPYRVNNETDAETHTSFNIKDYGLREYQIKLFDRIFTDWMNAEPADIEAINGDLMFLGMELRDTGDGWYGLYKLGNNSMFGADELLYESDNLEEIFWDERSRIEDEFIGERDDFYLSTDSVVRLVLAMNEYKIGANYDGIIIDDIFDSASMFGGTGTVVITLEDANQFKNADNAKPTIASDIRHSLDDGVEVSSKQTKELLDIIEHLKGEFETTKFAKADPKKLEKMTHSLLKEYSSNADFAETYKAVDELYTYMANGEDGHPPVWEDVYDRAKKIAQGIVEKALVVDDEMYRTYSNLRKYLHTTPIKFDAAHDSVPSGYESFNEFRKKNMGRLKFANDGVAVGTVYQELSTMYPEFFDEEEQSNAGDQLERIVEVLDELRAVEVNPFDGQIEQASTHLANDLASRFFDIPQAKPTFADKAERRVVEATIKGRKKVDAVREQKDAKVKKLIGEQRKKTKKQLDKLRKQRDDKVREERAKRRDAISKMSESQKSKVLRARITRHASDLGKKLTNPTDKQHIPHELQGAVAKLLECINLESNYTYDIQSHSYKKNDEGLPTKRTRAFNNLKKVYADIASSVVVDPDLVVEGGLLSNVISLADKRIVDMTSYELDIIWQTLRAIEASVSTVNKMFSQGKFKTILEVAEALREDNGDKVAKKEIRGLLGRGQKLAALDMLTPETYLHYLGDAGDSMFRMMRDAQDKHISIMKEVQDFTHKELNGVNVNKLEKTLHKVTLGGQSVELTTAQLMELYVLMNREQAVEHIFVGGILPDVIDTKGIFKKTKTEPIRNITQEEIGAALSKLSAEEKAVADKLQKFVSTVLSQHGNEASMSVYNYEKFLEENYWTIRTNKQEIASDVSKDTAVTTVANKGMAKGTVPHANTSVRIGSIFDTFAAHSSDMATYAAWLGTTEDINRIRNFVFWEDGARTGTVKGILDTVHGTQGSKYLEKLLTDISIGVRGADSMNPLDRLTGYYKAASVGANIRVIIQQPTAIWRALDMVNPQYLIKGAARPLKGWKQAKKHAPIAQWKDWGHFDINTGRQMKDVLFDNASLLEKTKQVGMWGTAMADSVAWGQLWNAVELETRDKHKGLQVGSDEYYATVSKRFTEIVDHTQVVDGILQRSGIMRSADSLTKMATAFMGEPAKQYNMAMAAAYDAKTKTGKDRRDAIHRLGRTAAGLAVAGIANACAQSIIDALRDDDKEKDYWEKWLAAFLGSEDDAWFQKGGNLGDNFNPISFIPFAKDVASIFAGYDVKRMDMEAISKLVKSAENMHKAITDTGKYTLAEATANLFAAIATMYGLPVANVKRDIKSIVTTAAIESENYLMQYRIEKAMLKINYSGNSKNFMDILFNAYNNDREAYEFIYKDMLKSGYEADKIKSGMEMRMMKAEGVEKASELSKRYMTPDDEKVYDDSLAKVKSSRVWESANEEQRKNAETDLYNFLTSTSEAMEEARAEANTFGVDETEYTLWQLAKEMADRDSNKSLNASEKAKAVNLLDLGNSEIAYFYNTDVADEAFASGVDMLSYALFKGAIADLEKSSAWLSYTNEQKKKAKRDIANKYAKNERDYLFLLGTEYESVKDDPDYISFFGN